MRSCEGCMYWSELLAQAIGGGPVQAMCLHPDKKRIYTYSGCNQKIEGDPVDLPNYGREGEE